MKLHRDHVSVLQFCKLAINIGVVDFAGSRFMSAGNIGDMNQADDVYVLLELLDQVALGDLFVEKIVEELHLGVVDGANDLDRFRCGLQEVVRILFRIDALKQKAHGLTVDLVAIDKFDRSF